jgi:hypothetical protein
VNSSYVDILPPAHRHSEISFTKIEKFSCLNPFLLEWVLMASWLHGRSESEMPKIESQLRDQIRDQLRGQLWGQIGGQLWDQIRNQLGDQIRNQLRDQM